MYKGYSGRLPKVSTISDLMLEWDIDQNNQHNLNPNKLTIGSDVKVWWKCSYGHMYQSAINGKFRRNRGCPFCSGHKVLKGFNDLETLFPEIASEWHPTKNNDLKPDMVAKASHKKIWWLGKCNHEWQATIKNRSLQNQGCPKCSNIKTKLTFKNKYGELHPTQTFIIKQKIINTNLAKRGVAYPLQDPTVADKAAKSANKITEIICLKNNKIKKCRGGYEIKIANYFNKLNIAFETPQTFKIPMHMLTTATGRQTVYTPDFYLPEFDKYIEAKGKWYDEESKLKWEWFNKNYPNSELWDTKKLKELNIL